MMRMIKVRRMGAALLCGVFPGLFSTGASAEKIDYSKEELHDRIKVGVKSTHPRLYRHSDDWSDVKAKIAGDPVLQQTYEFILTKADLFLEKPLLERTMDGHRLLIVSRECFRRVTYLSLVYRVSGEEKYLNRAETEMRAAAAFDDWNPYHFLDVAEMTAGLAIGYDWLYNDLSEETRTVIREAIVEKGLLPALAKPHNWVTRNDNWNAVCHAGMVIGALAVMDDEDKIAQQTIERALENVHYSLEEYAPDGIYAEGPIYWRYGTRYTALMIDALESALGHDYDLSQARGFLGSATFYTQVTAPDGQFFNYSDSGTARPVTPVLHWFAKKQNEPGLLWDEVGILKKTVAHKPTDKTHADRLLAWQLLWADPDVKPTQPTQTYFKGAGHNPLAMMRSSWDDDASFVALKGGDPGASHGHMDIGSFVVVMDGVRWGVDISKADYGPAEDNLKAVGLSLWDRSQTGGRWLMFRLNNLSHNTLVVDHQPQRVETRSSFIDVSDVPGEYSATLDMTPAIEGQLKEAIRDVRLVGKAVEVEDHVTTVDKKNTHIRWGMATHANVSISGKEGRKAVLSQDGKSMTLRILSPEGARLRTYDMENPPRSWDEKNPNMRMIGFEVELPANTCETFLVRMDPGTK
jgi:hypothetical protein